jgi:hypothetical protein
MSEGPATAMVDDMPTEDNPIAIVAPSPSCLILHFECFDVSSLGDVALAPPLICYQCRYHQLASLG